MLLFVFTATITTSNAITAAAAIIAAAPPPLSPVTSSQSHTGTFHLDKGSLHFRSHGR